VSELKVVHDQIKQKDKQLLAMNNQLNELEKEKKTWTDSPELLKDQIGFSLNMGF